MKELQKIVDNCEYRMYVIQKEEKVILQHIVLAF